MQINKQWIETEDNSVNHQIEIMFTFQIRIKLKRSTNIQ